MPAHAQDEQVREEEMKPIGRPRLSTGTVGVGNGTRSLPCQQGRSHLPSNGMESMRAVHAIQYAHHGERSVHWRPS